PTREVAATHPRLLAASTSNFGSILAVKSNSQRWSFTTSGIVQRSFTSLTENFLYVEDSLEVHLSQSTKLAFFEGGVGLADIEFSWTGIAHKDFQNRVPRLWH